MFCINHGTKVLLIVLTVLCVSNALYTKSEYVTELNVKSFEEKVEKRNSIWFLQFYEAANDNCLDFVEEYNRAGKALKGFVRMGAIDVDEELMLAYQYEIIKVPTILLRNCDGDIIMYDNITAENTLIEYGIEGIISEIKQRAIEKLVQSKYVKQLTSNDIDKRVKSSHRRWMIVFYKSEETEGLASIWENVANKLNATITFGSYDLDHDLAQQNAFDFTNVPSIVYYDNKTNMAGTEYKGELNSDEITAWALEKLPVPVIHHIQDEDLVRKTCVKNEYCILTILPNPNFCNKTCELEHKALLGQIAANYKQYSWGWLMMSEGFMRNIDIILDVSADTKAVLVTIVHVKTFKYEQLDKPFSRQHLEEMLQKVINGSGFTHVLPVFENLSEKVYKPWVHDEL